MKPDFNSIDIEAIESPVKPGDVHMMIYPDGTLADIKIVDRYADRNFTNYMKECVINALNTYPQFGYNNFIVQYRLGPSFARKSNESIYSYVERVYSEINKSDTKPINTFRLHPLLYCYQNNLNPLLPENSEQNLSNLSRYNIFTYRYQAGSEQEIQQYVGIETDKGVVIFDDSEKGVELQDNYKQYFINNFFDPKTNTTFYRTLDLIPSESQKLQVNPDLTPLFNDNKLPDSSYVDITNIGISDVKQHYPMIATLENFQNFSGLSEGELPPIREDTYTIICLLHLSNKECVDPVISHEYCYIFTYMDEFMPLETQWEEADNESGRNKALNEIRALATKLLKEHYPYVNIEQGHQHNVEKKEQQQQSPGVTQNITRQLPSARKKGGHHL